MYDFQTFVTREAVRCEVAIYGGFAVWVVCFGFRSMFIASLIAGILMPVYALIYYGLSVTVR